MAFNTAQREVLLGSERPTILLVIDRPTWAFGFIAERIAGELKDSFKIDIVATETISRSAFFRTVRRVNPDIIHFFWRKELLDIVNELSDNARYIKRRKALSSCHITFSVPDHLYSSLSDIIDTSIIFNISSGYVVTSVKLLNLYNNYNIVPAPMAIIHDLYTPTSGYTKHRKGRKIRFVWVGNSMWGHWSGLIDHKGVTSIVNPLFRELSGKYNDDIETIMIDSAVRHISKGDVSKILKDSDIVICASESEGTPLPLLEAMEVGCAVITTDVGIAREVLPDVQKPYIVERTFDAFFNAAVRLVDDREALEQIQAANRRAFEALDRTGVGKEWSAFFHAVLESPRRSSLLGARFDLNPHLRGAAPFISRFTRSKQILRAVSRITAPRRGQLTRQALKHIEETMLSASIGLAANKYETLFIANPRWLGIFNSTATLARGACLPYPRLTWRDADSIRDDELSLVAETIASVRPRQIVLSGGERYQVRLARRLRSLAPQMEISVIWHGQLAQWASDYERDVFREWLAAYSAGVIGKIGTMKQSLDKVLLKQGVRAFRLSNFIPSWASARYSLIDTSAGLDVGLWAASGEYRKNIFTQLMSVVLCNKEITINHCFAEQSILDVLERFKIRNKRWGWGSLKSDMLSIAMSKTQLTLYVTLGECSPMVPLESMAAGTPALVGPVSDVYDCDTMLRSVLTVDKPETPAAIAAAINRASDARTSLLARRDEFLNASRELGLARLETFLVS
jgi:glycosyltransferase involved in cell wall biosynthesis